DPVFDVCEPVTSQENWFAVAQNGEGNSRNLVCEHLLTDDPINVYYSFTIFAAQLLREARCCQEDDCKEGAGENCFHKRLGQRSMNSNAKVKKPARTKCSRGLLN